MQIAVAADDPTKAPFIRSEWPDPRCSLSYDELWRRLEASHFGQDVDLWRSTFILGVGSNGGVSGGNVDPCCKSCHRKISQHHTDGTSYVYDASHRYKKRTPISCGVVQSRLLRNKQHALQAQQRGGLHGLGALGLLAFHQDPARPGVDLCRACNYSIEEHANGTDPADAMVNALGLGGLAGMAHAMSGAGGPQMVGGNHTVQLTAQQQQYLDQREQIAVLLRGDAAGQHCPHSAEYLDDCDEASSYERNKELWSLHLEHKSRTERHGNSETTYRWVACRNCGGKVHEEHMSDPVRAQERAARDPWQPRGPTACGITSGAFDTHRQRLAGQGGGGIMGSVQAAAAAAVLRQHPQTGDEVCGKCAWAVRDHPVGPDPAVVAQQQVQAMMGGMLSGMGLGAFAPMMGVNASAARSGGGAQPVAVAQQPYQTQHQQPQAASSPYQQFGGGGAAGGGGDDYVEVVTMELCCGCIPRTVRKRVKRSQMGFAGMGAMPGMMVAH